MTVELFTVSVLLLCVGDVIQLHFYMIVELFTVSVLLMRGGDVIQLHFYMIVELFTVSVLLLRGGDVIQLHFYMIVELFTVSVLLLHGGDVIQLRSSVHHQQFFTVHTAVVYAIRLASRIRTELLASCQQTCMTYIPLLCVQGKTADDGQRNCPKHVEFYSKNKFEKLVHLVGFIVRIFSCIYF